MDVEIWSDIACPWCYVGKRRFEAALARFEHRGDVRVTWRSFELDPGAPDEREGVRAARLAVEVGLDEDEVRGMVASDRFAEEVRDDERTAHAFGISAVPTFVVDRSIGVSGAHPPEALLELLREGWARRAPAPVVVTGGEACGVDGDC